MYWHVYGVIINKCIQLSLQHLKYISAYSDIPEISEMHLDLNIWNAFWFTAYSSQIGEGCASAQHKCFKKCSILPLINLECIQIFLNNLKCNKCFKYYSNVLLIYISQTYSDIPTTPEMYLNALHILLK